MATFTTETEFGTLSFETTANNMTVFNEDEGLQICSGDVDNRIFNEDQHEEMVKEFIESFYGVDE